MTRHLLCLVTYGPVTYGPVTYAQLPLLPSGDLSINLSSTSAC